MWGRGRGVSGGIGGGIFVRGDRAGQEVRMDENRMLPSSGNSLKMAANLS